MSIKNMNLLELMSDANALYDAFIKSKENCEWKESVQRFEANLLTNVMILQKELREGTYKQRPFHEFDINERGKVRHIKALDVRDRVVQRSLCDNVLVPILKKYLIYDNGASLENKGLSFSRRRFVIHLSEYYKEYGNDGYILHIDFKKYFDSIPHKQMITFIEEKITDTSINWLIEDLINYFPGDYGLGIGSQISQICGIFYPYKFDNYIKIVKGIKYYGRYMDDAYILSYSKEFLQELLNELKEIANQLGLTLNEKKTYIAKIDKQIVFLKVKYTLLDSGEIIKNIHRTNIVRERRRLKKYAAMVDRNEKTFKDVYDQYYSWRQQYKKYNAKHTIQSMDDLFNQLFLKGDFKYVETKTKRRNRDYYQ